MADPRRPILVGYMVFDEWTEDYSYWSGQITGPDNPRGANLAWLDPIPMIEKRAFNRLRLAVETEHARHHMKSMTECGHQACRALAEVTGEDSRET